jgi:hypothetical protein
MSAAVNNCPHGNPDEADCLDCQRSRSGLVREVAFIRDAMRQSFENGFEIGKLRAQRILAQELGPFATARVCALIEKEVAPE